MNIAQHNTIVLDYIQRAQRRSIVPHHISAEVGEFLAMLVMGLQAQRLLEIGTLWGYSTWWLAQGIANQPAAQIVTIEKERKHHTLAEQFFAATGLANVQLKLGDAQLLLAQFGDGEFDFIFLDADRRDYSRLLPKLTRLLRVGGLLVIDNLTADMMTHSGQLLAPQLELVFLAGNLNLQLALKR